MEPEVEIRKSVEKSVGILSAGGACDRVLMKLDATVDLDCFHQWLCSLQLDQSEKECLRREKQLAKLWKRLKRRGFKEGKGREFRLFSRCLGSPNDQLVKDLEFALSQMPFSWQVIEDSVRDLGEFITGVGGAQVLWVHLSSGGHSVPLFGAMCGLSRSMLRPAKVIMEIVRPTPAEKAATSIFGSEMPYIIGNDYLGADGLVLVDNSCADRFRSLRELDLIAAMATMAPLASKPPRSRLHHLEVWDLLTKKGRLIGLWGRRIPIIEVGVVKRTLFGIPCGTRWTKDKHALIGTCLSGLHSLIEDHRTSLSGLPALPDGENVYCIVGDISESTFKVVEKEWAPHGICLYAPAPRLKHIYLVRLGNVDEEVLRQEISFDAGPTEHPGSWKRQDCLDFDTVIEVLASRAQIPVNDFATMWDKRRSVK